VSHGGHRWRVSDGGREREKERGSYVSRQRREKLLFFLLIFFAFSCNVADATSVRKQNLGKPSGSLAFLQELNNSSATEPKFDVQIKCTRKRTSRV
jgi:hypothetical protein